MAFRGFRLIALVLTLLGLSLAFRPDAHVFDTPLTEDAYYSLGVARNVALGNGMTIDGTMPTNGFQPLFTMMEAAAYWLAGNDEAMALRLVLGLSAIIWAATAGVVGLIARDAVPDTAADAGTGDTAAFRGWLAAVLYLAGFLGFMHHFNGLETGLLMLVYALLWRAWQLGWYDRASGPLVFGIGMGALVLTRIDSAIFTVVFGLFLVWRDRRGGLPALRRALLRAALVAGVAALVSAPWWAYNYLEFGRLMPTSGTAQQEWALNERRWRWIFWALGVTGMPQLWLGKLDETFYDGILLSILRAVIGLGLIALLVRRWKAEAATLLRTDATRRTVEFAAVLLTALGILCLFYGFSFIAYWFYYRYLFPFCLVATVAIAWIAAPYLQNRQRIAVLLVALLAVPTAVSAVLAHRGQTLHVQTVYWEQLELIARHVPPEAAVAAGQAGTLGYFRANVVNTDGKVNRAVIPHQDRMWDYLRETGVEWFCDWPNYVEKYLGPDPTAHGWVLVDTLGFWRLWRYVGPPKP